MMKKLIEGPSISIINEVIKMKRRHDVQLERCIEMQADIMKLEEELEKRFLKVVRTGDDVLDVVIDTNPQV